MTLLDLSPSIRDAHPLASLPVAVIGAGPVGLAAAAHLVERGIDFVLVEAGSTPASSMRAWGHTRLFSPWRHLVDPASRRLLEATGWTFPDPDRLPTGTEVIERYLEPLAALDAIASRLRTSTDVIGVTREGMDRTRTRGRSARPFRVRVRSPHSVTDIAARAVIDASGTFRSPNPLSSGGLDLLGAEDVADRIVAALPDVRGRDRARFSGRHVSVVGAGHSAANTLLALVDLARDEPSTTVTWIIRTPSAVRVSGSPDDDLSERARLGEHVDRAVADGVITVLDGFEIDRAQPQGDGIRLSGTRHGAPASHDTDLVVAATGFRPDLSMLREIRLDLDDIVEAPRRLAPLIDPNVHSCGTVPPHGFRELAHPEAGLFIVGMKSYGRAPTFLLATGYEQVRSVVAWIDGDTAAASTVSLTLPETGVCTVPGGGDGCC